MTLVTGLPRQTHNSQTSTFLCGDFNARSLALLGDTRTNTRGTQLHEWITTNGIYCWNSLLAKGEPTLCSTARVASDSQPTGHSSWSSVIDLFLSYGPLVEPSLVVRQDSLGSDHLPVSLTFTMESTPPPSVSHPRLLWKLYSLDNLETGQLYRSLFKLKSGPLKHQLLAEVKCAIELFQSLGSNPTTHDTFYASGVSPPDVNSFATDLQDVLYFCMDHSLGRKKAPRPPGNTWFWTDSLQDLVSARSSAYTKWKRTRDGLDKALRWKKYLTACDRFNQELKRRRRETWKRFCEKLSSDPFVETMSTVKRLKRNRTTSPSYSHPEGPSVAAYTMSSHLRSVFAGDNLPPLRPTAPSLPKGPNITARDIHYLARTFGADILPLEMQASFSSRDIPAASASDCPFKVDVIALTVRKKLARRKAPGIDHLRTEMLLPVLEDLAPILGLLYYLCWIWCRVPEAWCTAQVVPIYKKGSPLDAANYRPISLTSVLRKLMELCLYPDLLETAPPLDIVQGGFRQDRGTLDQALALHELCKQHAADHFGAPPVLCFLDIKQAYDTVDRNIIWRELETHVSEPLLGLLQCLFDNVQIEVLVSGAKSPTFWPSTGVLQGSILSPFLYSIYINSLPAALRTDISMATRSRMYPGTLPQRQFNDRWFNCLLYADDVVLLGTPATMPRLLKKVEEHSTQLGYRWNPTKCVTVYNPRSHGENLSLKLYNTPIPVEASFSYLGLPFNVDAQLDATLLLERNARSALVAMRTGIQPLGVHSPGFSRLTSARIYSTFIRPKLEYGLAISSLLVKHIKILEKAQDQCLRLAFGGHSKASTKVFKHLTALPSMRDRAEILTFKMMIRMQQVPQDTLLGSLRSHIFAYANETVRFQWPKLLRHNKLFIDTCPRDLSVRQSASDRLDRWIDSTGGDPQKMIIKYRRSVLTTTLAAADAPVLLSACRPCIGVDPLLYLPMSVWERSRLLRWKMGWLPGRPIACRCGHAHASRRHLVECLSVTSRLGVPLDAKPNPLDFVLNQLPKLKHTPSSFDQRHKQSLTRWSSWWPTVCAIFVEIDQICLPDEEFSTGASDAQGLTLLKWLLPEYFVQVAPVRQSTLLNYL
jgi:hypothetical protein